MKVLFIIWLVISALAMFFAYGVAAISAKKCLRKHGIEPPKYSFKNNNLEAVLSLLRTALMCMIPIFHILILFFYIFAGNKVMEITDTVCEEKFDEVMENA